MRATPPDRREQIQDPCRLCGVRWVNCWTGPSVGLCRGCARATGVLGQTTVEMEAERVARHLQKLSARKVPDTSPRPTREIVIDHEIYEVVWDGS